MHIKRIVMIYNWCFLFITLCTPNIFGSLPQPYTDANGYHYKNEREIRDSKKIAVLAYGSLAKQRENRQTGALLETTQFKPTDLYLPVSLLRQSQGPRLTAVIDPQGHPKKVWAATSHFQYLPNARNNVAAREGSRYLGQNKGYDLTNIFYMKKLVPNHRRDCNEKEISGTSWVISTPRTKQQRRHELPEDTKRAIAQWADGKGYTAVVWASFTPNIKSQREATRRLLQDDVLLRNTQNYVRNLADGAQSPFERAVMGGAEALERLMR